jgi:molybdopterin-guanine dinucleotide biosynthesis protein A
MQVADKTRLIVGGRQLLDRVIAAGAGAERIVVVGPQRRTDVPVAWTCEEPPGGGPAAAVAAGLEQVQAAVVVLLAGDLPFVTASHIAELVEAVTDAGAVYVDDNDREQWLCSAWRSVALRSLALRPGAALRETLGTLPAARLHPRAGGPQVWQDLDTPADVRRAEEQQS